MHMERHDVLAGYKWLSTRVKNIRAQAIEHGRKLDHIRMHKETYDNLKKNFKKYSPLDHNPNDDIMIYGIVLKPYKFDHTMMIAPVWAWKTVEGIY